MAKLIYKQVDVIDRLPDIKYDEEKLVVWLLQKRNDMQSARTEWLARYRKYLSQWDDFITYIRTGPWDDSSNLHLPLSMEKMRTFHARLKQAIFAMQPPWMMQPLERLDIGRVKTIDLVMKWAIANYVNRYKGIESTIDDWIWDFAGVGWAVIKRRWEVVQRKAIRVSYEMPEVEPSGEAGRMREIMGNLEQQFEENNGAPPEEMPQAAMEKVAREVEELITFFDGPVIETIPHEDILFPGIAQDSSDMNEHALVCHDFKLDTSTFKLRVEQGFYGEKNADLIMKFGLTNATPDANVAEIKRAQDDYQGVSTVDQEYIRPTLNMSEMYATYDIDGDGIDEELIITMDLDARAISRLTYLDRVTTTGRRPLHKIDFIRRPRRTYSLGLLEMLYPLNQEIDAIHNMRMDFGTLSNIPFFFYRSSCGIKGAKFKIEPGVGYPVDDPRSDVYFPSMPNSTNFGTMEEAAVDRWADRLTSTSVMNSGMPTERVGASRTAAGMMALLNEGNINIDVVLSRLKIGYADLLKGLLADLQERLPPDIAVRVVGASGGDVMGPDGKPLFLSPTRQDIAGRLDFILTANSQNTNRELDKQNAMQMLQLALNPMATQTGIVSPINIYNLYKNVFEKQGCLVIDEVLTEPTNAAIPMRLDEEISAIRQGIIPKIVLNDDHDAKVKALLMFAVQPEFIEGIKKGVNHPDAMKLLSATVDVHKMMAGAIAAQQQMQNQSGLQISPSAGARMSGQVGETGRPLPQENLPNGQQAAGTEARMANEGQPPQGV